jgi:hypothetical protein
LTRPALLAVATVLLAGLVLATPRAQQSAFMSVDDVRPGMVGIGRTVFEGNQLEDFTVNVIGVLRNIIGPGRDLILARLEGGPLATTGVMQGMSGSPVYIDGRLLGAVSYALGSFPREPIAGITPIAEMTAAVDSTSPRVNGRDLDLEWPATPERVYAALGRVAARATGRIGRVPFDTQITGPATLADLAPDLHPIGAAMVVSGFDPQVDLAIRHAFSSPARQAQAPATNSAAGSLAPLRGGDPVGMSLVRGDMETGATGTVTYVDGSRVYTFGHPYLNLGPTSIAMTEAHVLTVLPSLDVSLKIASMGRVIGTMTQDRATAVGGTLGTTPDELEMHLTLAPERGPEREFTFFVLQDPQLTSLFAYVTIYNTLVAYERQTGALTIAASGSTSFGPDGTAQIDDLFSGPSAVGVAASTVTAAIAAAASNDFRSVTARRLDLRLEVSERQQTTTIERAWLDTTRPVAGQQHTLHVLLRDYQGAAETISIPVTMPARAAGPLTLLVSDGATLAARERSDLRPGRPTHWPSGLQQVNTRPRGTRLYGRLIASSTGTVVA